MQLVLLRIVDANVLVYERWHRWTAPEELQQPGCSSMSNSPPTSELRSGYTMSCNHSCGSVDSRPELEKEPHLLVVGVGLKQHVLESGTGKVCGSTGPTTDGVAGRLYPSPIQAGRLGIVKRCCRWISMSSGCRCAKTVDLQTAANYERNRVLTKP